MSTHPWERVAPRWYEWSMTVREDWKAWFGFAIPMFLLTCVAIISVGFALIAAVWWVVT